MMPRSAQSSGALRASHLGDSSNGEPASQNSIQRRDADGTTGRIIFATGVRAQDVLLAREL